MKKIKMISTNDPSYDVLITRKTVREGRTAGGWWYLDGTLENMMGYDKATIYNLTEFPELTKETILWNEIRNGVTHVDKIRSVRGLYANGSFPVEVYGVSDPCTAFFWVTEETECTAYLTGSDIPVKFLIWKQRGLVCLDSDIKSIEHARIQLSLRSTVL